MSRPSWSKYHVGGNPSSFVDALQAAATQALAYQHAAAEPLPGLADEIERVAALVNVTAPFHAQRLNRVVAEVRAIAAELTPAEVRS